MLANKQVAKRFFILLLMPLMAIFLVGCLNGKSQPVKNDLGQTDQNINSPQAEVPLSIKELEESYRRQVADILQPFFGGNNAIGIKDQILSLKAPAKYVDLHFNLVVVFELLEQGKDTADQAKIEQSLEKLDVIKIEYSWLGNNEL